MAPEDGLVLSRAVQRQSVLRVRGRSVGWVPPLLLLVGITLGDWNTSGEFRVLSWLVLVPAISAALCGVWGTGTYALLSLATYWVVDQAWPHQFRNGMPGFILVAVGGALAVVACWVRMREERRTRHMLNVADTIRRTVLRPLPPGFGGLDHAAVYLAADSEARVGGDFYDIQPGPHGTRVLLGDVQGKGLGAVSAAAELLSSIRESGYHERELATVARRLETRMRRHRAYARMTGQVDEDRFATAVLFGFSRDLADTTWVEVVNFGHQPPFAVSARGVRELPPGDGLPLGLSDLGVRSARVHRVPLAADETLLMVTDGVTEARDRAGEFFPLHSWLIQAVAADPQVAGPARLVRLVRDATLRHCNGRLGDDTTILAVSRYGGPAGRGGR